MITSAITEIMHLKFHAFIWHIVLFKYTTVTIFAANVC